MNRNLEIQLIVGLPKTGKTQFVLERLTHLTNSVVIATDKTIDRFKYFYDSSVTLAEGLLDTDETSAGKRSPRRFDLSGVRVMCKVEPQELNASNIFITDCEYSETSAVLDQLRAAAFMSQDYSSNVILEISVDTQTSLIGTKNELLGLPIPVQITPGHSDFFSATARPSDVLSMTLPKIIFTKPAQISQIYH